MEGIIAKWYAGLTKKSMKDFKALAQNTAMKIPAHSRILDLAPGPGYFAIELAKLGEYEMTGLDISQTFVEIARANAMASKVKVDFRCGSASAMPFTAEPSIFCFVGRRSRISPNPSELSKRSIAFCGPAPRL